MIAHVIHHLEFSTRGTDRLWADEYPHTTGRAHDAATALSWPRLRRVTRKVTGRS